MKTQCLKYLFRSAFLLLIACLSLNGVAFAKEGKNEGHGQSGQPEVSKIEQDLNKVVVRVNGAEITQEDLNREYSRLAPRTVPHKEIRKSTIKRLEAKALDSLIIKELKYQEAIKVGIKVDKKLIKEKMKNIKKKNKNLKKLLKEIGRDMKWLQLLMVEKPMLIKRLEKKVKKDLEKKVEELVTDEFVKDYYTTNMDKFKEPERRRIREITIRVNPGASPQDWDNAQKHMSELLERAKGGEDFALLAKEYSQDEYAKKGGDMGFVHQGSLEPKLEGFVDHMEPGDIEGPIWTIYGYHLLKLEEKTPPVQKEYHEVEERLKETLISREYKRFYKEWLEGLRDSSEIEVIKVKE